MAAGLLVLADRQWPYQGSLGKFIGLARYVSTTILRSSHFIGNSVFIGFCVTGTYSIVDFWAVFTQKPAKVTYKWAIVS